MKKLMGTEKGQRDGLAPSRYSITLLDCIHDDINHQRCTDCHGNFETFKISPVLMCKRLRILEDADIHDSIHASALHCNRPR